MGFVGCKRSIIVVDTATYPSQTKRDIQEMKEITEKPMKFLINTHYHPDHTFGNMYFEDIIAHTACRKLLKNRSSFYKEEVQKEEGFEDLTITYPNIVFLEKMVLYCSPEIVLTRLGGHTEGSITVYIPDERILFAGDLIFEGSHPYLGDADIQEWINALKVLLQWDIQKVVPGHGVVCDKKELKKHVDYLTIFYENLTELKEKYSKDELCENPDLLKLPEMNGRERIARNIEAQYDRI